MNRHVPVRIKTSPPRFRFAATAIILCLAGSGFLARAEAGTRAATLPASSAGTLAQHAPGRQTSPIRHVVVIFMENHSFDSLLGFWCDNHPGRCPDGGMPSSVVLSNGAVVTPSTDPDVVPVVRHTTVDQVNAINHGAMNGWQKLPGCQASRHYACVSGYQPAQIPNLSKLADNFTISDDTFSMQDSPSFFGHLYAVAATTDGFTGDNPHGGANTGAGWGCDSDKITTWVNKGVTRNVPSCIPDSSLKRPDGRPLSNGGAFRPTPVPYVPTIMDRLTAAGLSWRLYGARCAHERLAVNGLEKCAKSATQPLGYGWAICPSFAECLYSQSSGMASGSQFASDASAGRLPAFSVLTPGDDTDSEHNGFSMTTGDNWLGHQVAAVMNGADWGSTAIFIVWDDCGCFYDQVPPGTNPDGTPQGPRIPLVIVSPYARAGYTDRTPATFASILAYTEHNFGLPPLTVNDAEAYRFSEAFNYSRAPLAQVRMVTRPVPKDDHIVWSQAREDS
jgi:phospholipase C